MSSVPDLVGGGATSPISRLRSRWSDRHRSPLVAAALVIWLVLPLILTSPSDQNVLMLAMVWALAGLSLNVIWGYGGQFSMAQVALGGVSAYTYAILAVKAGWPIAISLAGGILMTVVVSLFVAAASFRLEGFRFAIMTLAFALVGTGLANNWSLTGQTQGLELPSSWAVLDIGPIHWDLTGRDGGFAILGTLVFFLLVGLWALILRTNYGRRVVALREDHRLADSLGIDPARYRISVFAISAVAAGVAGIFQAQYYAYLSPTFFGFTTLVNVIVVLVLGGPGRLFGPLVGGILYAVLTVALPISGNVQAIIFGAVIILLTIFAREGLAYYLDRGQRMAWNGLFGHLLDRIGARGGADRRVSEAGQPGPAGALGSAASRPAGVEVRTAGPAKSGGKILLEARDLHKSYGGVAAVDGLSLEVAAGEIFGIIGPNGAGKTTALNLLSGFAALDRGVVRWQGREITKASPSGRARRGLVRSFQQPRTFPKLTVRENVEIAAGHQADGVEAAESTLARFGLTAVAEELASSLSYGSAKRLGVAMAAATGAEMIMLDEPAAGLNAGDIGQLVEDLRQLRADGRTMCLVEHHMDMITSLCDRVLVLDAGHPILVDEPEAVINDERVIEAYLGTGS